MTSSKPEPAMQTSTVDLTTVDRKGGDGAVWSLPRGGDLDANLVHLRPDGAIGAHVNDDVDVLIVGIDGAANVTIDGTQHTLRAGVAIIVPKGASRAIHADPETDVSYLTVHHARASIRIRT
jgi:quercetin dioxygenase-like cupin family protein